MKNLLISSSLLCLLSICSAHSVELINNTKFDGRFVIADPLNQQYAKHLMLGKQSRLGVDLQVLFDDIKNEVVHDPDHKPITVEIQGIAGLYSDKCEPLSGTSPIMITSKTNITKLNEKKAIELSIVPDPVHKKKFVCTIKNLKE